MVGVTVTGPGEPDRLALDRDAALALDVHPVQVLRAHLAALDHAGELQHPVRQRRLAVVDVGDDAEVPEHGLIGVAGRRTGSRVRFTDRWHAHPFGLLALPVLPGAGWVFHARLGGGARYSMLAWAGLGVP